MLQTLKSSVGRPIRCPMLSRPMSLLVQLHCLAEKARSPQERNRYAKRIHHARALAGTDSKGVVGTSKVPIVHRAIQRGYAVVIQDVRGRYASGGEFRPYENEGRDGFDTIEWAAQQRWSSGDVGTFGLSYPGAVQWLAAVESPPHLKAMVPAMTFSTPRNFFYASGTWDMSWIEWIWDNIAPDVRGRKNLPGAKTAEEAIAAWKQAAPRMLNTLPLKQLEDLRGVAPYYYDWLSHPAEDPWWDWAELRNKYGHVYEVVLRWMDRYLRGADNGIGKEKAVRYFVMGDNTWRDADAW